MKRKFIKNSLRLAVFFALIPGLAHSGTEVGKVVSSSGKVMARIESKGAPRGQPPQVRFLKASDPVYLEDVINTDSNGSVKILFNDQSIMDLGQSSLFKVEEFKNDGKPEERKVEMSLSYGKIRAAINQKVGTLGKFKIKTRAATMGVRGTEFYVMSEMDSNPAGKESRSIESKAMVESAPQTKIVVTEGKVEVQTAKGPDPSAGFQKPVALLPGEKIVATLDSTISSNGVRAPASLPVIEKVAPEEMKTVVSEVKLKDTTFAQSIQIEPIAAKGDNPSAPAIALSGTETMAVIKDALLSKPEIRNAAPPVGGFSVPGGPMIQPNFTGNFLPGFITTPLVKLRIEVR